MLLYQRPTFGTPIPARTPLKTLKTLGLEPKSTGFLNHLAMVMTGIAQMVCCHTTVARVLAWAKVVVKPLGSWSAADVRAAVFFLSAFRRTYARDNFSRCHDVAKLLDKSFKCGQVLIVGQCGAAVGHHDHLEIEHHCVSTC